MSYIRTPEIREKMRAAQQRNWRDPEYRQRQSALITDAMNRPEIRAKTSATTFKPVENPGYAGLHTRLRERHPYTGVCEECGAEGKTEYAFLHHPEPHTDRREDYSEMCRPCHKAYDAPSARKEREHAHA